MLHGSWVSDDPRYAGRTLVMRPHDVRVLFEDRIIDIHAIEAVELDRQGRGIVVYTLRFTAAEQYPDAWVITLENPASPRIRIGAQRVMWRRQP